MQNHKKLYIWQRGIDLAKETYKLIKKFPKDELFGLTAQLKRSAASVPSNIAEGAGRQSPKEFLQFIHISIGSIKEVDTQLYLSKELNYIHSEEYEKISIAIDILSKQLNNYTKFLKKKIDTPKKPTPKTQSPKP